MPPVCGSSSIEPRIIRYDRANYSLSVSVIAFAAEIRISFREQTLSRSHKKEREKPHDKRLGQALVRPSGADGMPPSRRRHPHARRSHLGSARQQSQPSEHFLGSEEGAGQAGRQPDAPIPRLQPVHAGSAAVALLRFHARKGRAGNVRGHWPAARRGCAPQDAAGADRPDHGARCRSR